MSSPVPFSRRDAFGLVVWYSLAYAMLWLAERLYARGWPQTLTRKLVHAVAGTSPFVIVRLFEHRWAGLVPFASFVVVNGVAYRQRRFASIDRADSAPGTVYFALSISTVLAWLWRPGPRDRSPLALAAITMMAWGDAAAALIGERYGYHRYGRRSLEGSTTMLAVSALGSTLVLRALGGVGWRSASLRSLGAASLATLAEAISPAGLDNMVVPLLAAAALVASDPVGAETPAFSPRDSLKGE